MVGLGMVGGARASAAEICPEVSVEATTICNDDVTILHVLQV